MGRKILHSVLTVVIVSALLAFDNTVRLSDFASVPLPCWFVGGVEVTGPIVARSFFEIVLHVQERYGRFFEGQICYAHDEEELYLVKPVSGAMLPDGEHIANWHEGRYFTLPEKDEGHDPRKARVHVIKDPNVLGVKGRRFFWLVQTEEGGKTRPSSFGHTILADFYVDDGDVYRGHWKVYPLLGHERASEVTLGGDEKGKKKKVVQWGLGRLVLMKGQGDANRVVPAALRLTDKEASRFRAILWVPTYDPLLAQLSGTRDKSGRIKCHVERLTRPDKRTSQQLPIVRGSVLEADIRGQFITGNVLLSESDKNRLAGVSFEFGLVNWEW